MSNNYLRGPNGRFIGSSPSAVKPPAASRAAAAPKPDAKTGSDGVTSKYETFQKRAANATDTPAGERTRENASAMLPGEWDAMLAEDPELANLLGDDGTDGWLAGADTLLDRYFAMEDPTRIDPAAREQRISFRLGDDVTMMGFIDRIDVQPKTGDIRILDYKTGSSPKLGYEQKSLFQLKVYALAIRKSTGRTPKLLQLMYLGDGNNVRYNPTDAELDQVEKDLQGLWAKVNECHQSGNFPPKQTALCAYCSFKDKCPEFGGTVPPMPS